MRQSPRRGPVAWPHRGPATPNTGGTTAVTGEVPAVAAPALPAVVPPLVVVMVTHDPGPWFEETLRSVADQTYPDLSLLVIDTASAEDPTARVHAVVPSAHVHRLEDDPGFGAAANLVRASWSRGRPSTPSATMTWPSSPTRCVRSWRRRSGPTPGSSAPSWSTGTTRAACSRWAWRSTRPASLAPVAERGELDQEQHDAVRDVFAVPSACQLVRADLFRTLGGFDPSIQYHGDDVDLCWRAHVVGARVLIAPVTRVRHLEALGERAGRSTIGGACSLATGCAPRWWPTAWFHRLRVLPQARAVRAGRGALRRPRRAPGPRRDVLAAWPWNLRRHGQIPPSAQGPAQPCPHGCRTARSATSRWAAAPGFSAFLRGQFDNEREDRVATFARSSRDVAGSPCATAPPAHRRLRPRAHRRWCWCRRGTWCSTASRPSASSPSFPDLPVDACSRPGGAAGATPGSGRPGAQPTGYGHPRRPRLPLRSAPSACCARCSSSAPSRWALGAWRLAQPIGSTRASVAALHRLPRPPGPLQRPGQRVVERPARLRGVAVDPAAARPGQRRGPVRPGGREPDEPGAHLRGVAVVPLVLGLGLVLAVVAAFVPFVIVLAVAGGRCAQRRLDAVLPGRRPGPHAGGGARRFGGGAGPPPAVEPRPRRSPSPWDAIAGVGSTGGRPLTLGEILRFESGPWGAPPLGWAFLLAGALPVIIGRSWRLEWAVRAWMVVLAGWAVLWAGQQGHLPGGPAGRRGGAGARWRPRWPWPPRSAWPPSRPTCGPTASGGARSCRWPPRSAWCSVPLPLASGLLDGRWRMPDRDYQRRLARVARRHRRPCGLPGALGGRRRAAAGERLALRRGPGLRHHRRGARPRCSTGFVVPEPGAVAAAGRCPRRRRGPAAPTASATCSRPWACATSWCRRSSRPPGPRRPMPRATMPASPPRPSPRSSPSSSTSRRSRSPTAWSSTATLAWVSSPVGPARPATATAPTFTEAVADDLSGAEPALTEDRRAPSTPTGEVPAEGDLLVVVHRRSGTGRCGSTASPWPRSETYGWANQFDATRTGEATLVLRHAGAATRGGGPGAAVGAGGCWSGAASGRATRRRRRRDGAAAGRRRRPPPPAPDPGRRGRGPRRSTLMARRQAARHARRVRRITPRRWLPFVALLAVIAAAVVVSRQDPDPRSRPRPCPTPPPACRWPPRRCALHRLVLRRWVRRSGPEGGPPSCRWSSPTPRPAGPPPR